MRKKSTIKIGGIVGLVIVAWAVYYQYTEFGIDKVMDTSTSWIIGVGIIIPILAYVISKRWIKGIRL